MTGVRNKSFARHDDVFSHFRMTFQLMRRKMAAASTPHFLAIPAITFLLPLLFRRAMPQHGQRLHAGTTVSGRSWSAYIDIISS